MARIRLECRDVTKRAFPQTEFHIDNPVVGKRNNAVKRRFSLGGRRFNTREGFLLEDFVLMLVTELHNREIALLQMRPIKLLRIPPRLPSACQHKSWG